MKEFTAAVEEVQFDDEREQKILGLMTEVDGQPAMTREEAEEATEPFIEFKMDDGRVMHAYHPEDGQLAFLMASMGRGQSNDQRFAAIINLMLACLRDDDRDYLENRLLQRGKGRLRVKQVEEVFAFLSEEWFQRPTN